MNIQRSLMILGVVFLCGLGAVSAQNNGGRGYGYQGGQNPSTPRGNNGGGLLFNLPPATTDTLPPEVIELMLAGWLDEQHAYAVYGSVIEQLGTVRPFVNIQQSEAQHIAAWETLFARYQIALPPLPTFELPPVTSLSAACALGVTAETANFDLYDTMLTTFAPYPDLLYVSQNLRAASEFSHLPAFERCTRR
jgi:hypothetical protein